MGRHCIVDLVDGQNTKRAHSSRHLHNVTVRDMVKHNEPQSYSSGSRYLFAVGTNHQIMHSWHIWLFGGQCVYFRQICAVKAVLGITERLPFTSMVVPLLKPKWSTIDLFSISSPPYCPTGANIEIYRNYVWL